VNFEGGATLGAQAVLTVSLTHWMKLRGKGGKERAVPLAESIAQELQVYLEMHRPLLLKRGNTDSLLVNDRGNRPSRVDIRRWIKMWARIAGVTKPIHPHSFRHGYATALLESGADLRSIQMLLGHANILTTQIYTSVSTKQLLDAVSTKHPLTY
jgi:integrase/recombinase XerD